MAIGYAAFQTQLKVTGSSTVTSNWDIEITNVTAGTPTGSAENAVAPSFDKLWASMEANLYDKGDAMEYDVTIENKGTLDAKLNDIITNLDKENNEAVIITFSGYTKGEVLKAQTSKVVHVKIEYNPEYEGGETSSEVEINFDYGQNNNEENNPDSQYLLTYDYSTNGGTSVELTEELIASGSNVDLSNAATKEGWTFVGWNTDKDAQIGLENYQMPASNTTLYAIYSKTLKVTYEKGENIDSIGKNEDSCNIYNNQTSCEITLPEITVTDDSATVGWYEGNNKIGNPNDKYTITNDITLRAEAEVEPIIKSWWSSSSEDFHAKEYKTNIITATFLDNKEVPEGATSWDVSAEKNGSVMAWVIPDETDSTKYHLYIGGDGGVIANHDSSYLFKNFTNLQTITFGDNFDTSNVTNMIDMFYNCSSLTTLDVSNWNTSNVTRMESMFQDCSSLTTLDVSKWDTSNVTDMSFMFYDCSSLTTLDVSNWDTSNVTNIYYMFYNCSSLTTLDLSNWDTGNVIRMDYMFYNCSKLTTIDVSNWDTSNVIDMSYMFRDCSSLTTLDVSNWNTSNVTYIYYMFYNCSSLTTLDLSNWDTSKVTNMNNMFFDCRSLTKLVLCNWNTSKVTEMHNMFRSTTNLKSIYVGPNWTTENAETANMFSGSGVSEVTQSNNCEYDAEEMSLEISTTSTTNSITVIATAHADSGIAKYEYSKDGGQSWVEGTSNTYTFTGLTAGTAYDIKVRVTSNIGKTLEKGIGVDITNNVVTTGDGLYEDTYESGRYIYKGANPNNYITFNNETWRIISIEADGSIKIMRNESIGSRAWDSSIFSDWETSDIKSYLNGDYLATITTNQDKIVPHTWSIGEVTYNNSDLADQINDENGTQSQQANVGMITVSEYLRANTNTEQCGNFSLNNSNYSTCKTTDWMFNIVPSNGHLWTISHYASSIVNSVFSVLGGSSDAGRLNHIVAFNSFVGVSPAVYLSSDITLSGSGTQSNPYKINQGVSTSTLEKPTFTETDTDNGKTVTITYPSGCGDSLTCTYQKDNGSVVNVTNSTVNVEFTESGSLVTNVSDGTNNVNISYTVELLPTVSFSNNYEENGKATLTMTFDDRCSSQYNCTYKIGNGNEVIVKHKTVIYEYYKTAKQTVTATISNGNNKTTNTYDITNNVIVPIPLAFSSNSIINETNSDLIIGKSYINWSNSNSYIFNSRDSEPAEMSEDWQEMLNSSNFPELDSYADYQIYPFGIRIYDLSQIEVDSENKTYLTLHWAIDDLDNASEYYLIYFSTDQGSINILELEDVDTSSKSISFSADVSTLKDNQYTTIMYLVYR